MYGVESQADDAAEARIRIGCRKPDKEGRNKIYLAMIRFDFCITRTVLVLPEIR
jgi:hypothetical protein